MKSEKIKDWFLHEYRKIFETFFIYLIFYYKHQKKIFIIYVKTHE